MNTPEDVDSVVEGPEPSTCDVLIADDSGQTRELLAAFLRRLSPALRIQQARNGTEALALWRLHKPHLCFLDIDMPGQDGVQVLKTLRRLHPDAFVVMVSGCASADNVRNSLQAGASGFIVKPYKSQRIAEVFDRYRKLRGKSLDPVGSISA
jgi:two-component system chemotaxis response regulator CheY